MDMMAKIALHGIVPVIKLQDPKDAVPLCAALANGGLPVAEITFRSDAAEESIRRVSRALPHIVLGAGTVLTVENVDKAVAAGAKYIVSPGFNPKVVAHCLAIGVPVLPGCSNPSDIEAALEMGLSTVKFFPAEAVGGLNAIKAMSAPYGNLKFIPTGGINEKNLNDYLAFPKILACGGSWMVPENLIEAGEFDKITALTRSAVEKMLGFELAHIGVNCACEEEAVQLATLLSGLFGWPMKNGNSSAFAGTAVELMKAPGRGAKGHIAIRTNSVPRARQFLEMKGIAFDEQSAVVKEGKLIAIYLTQDFGGFALHLLQK